ncbi:MAG: DoxX family membrane protein [Bryobacteraceae bacterium]|nr:DoxX family membrane protein [Bryobacteraceae bacterium]
MSTVEDVGVPAEVAEKRLRLKAAASAIAALVLSLVFLASGIWKVTDLNGTAERVIQLLVPVPLSLPAAFAAAVAETFAGVLLLIPRFRRWGAWLAALMLIVFMAYFAVFYDRLLGGRL